MYALTWSILRNVWVLNVHAPGNKYMCHMFVIILYGIYCRVCIGLNYLGIPQFTFNYFTSSPSLPVSWSPVLHPATSAGLHQLFQRLSGCIEFSVWQGWGQQKSTIQTNQFKEILRHSNFVRSSISNVFMEPAPHIGDVENPWRILLKISAMFNDLKCTGQL